MMEIKCYKSTLIEVHFIFLTWGRLAQGQVFMGPICRGPIWQRAELSSSRLFKDTRIEAKIVVISVWS